MTLPITMPIVSTLTGHVVKGDSGGDPGPPPIVYAVISGAPDRQVTIDDVLQDVWTFDVSGDLTVTSAGYLHVRAVAGGGGGGNGGNNAGGGGGGGVPHVDVIWVEVGVYPIVIGAGGSPMNAGSPTTGLGLDLPGGGRGGGGGGQNEGGDGGTGGGGLGPNSTTPVVGGVGDPGEDGGSGVSYAAGSGGTIDASGVDGVRSPIRSGDGVNGPMCWDSRLGSSGGGAVRSILYPDGGNAADGSGHGSIGSNLNESANIPPARDSTAGVDGRGGGGGGGGRGGFTGKAGGDGIFEVARPA